MAGRAEHRGVACGAAAVGVGAGVVRAVVRLDLGEAQLDRAVGGGAYKDAAQQVRGDLQDGAVEERPGSAGVGQGRDHAVRA